nr:TatD family hydrolase [SAR324 cluster bacterium]
MTSFIDTHCHLDMLPVQPEESVALSRAARVVQLITISIDEASMEFVDQFTRKHAGIYGSVGIHPHDSSQFSDEILSRMQNILHTNPDIVAVGETGLDYHYMKSPLETQKHSFREHLKFAEKVQLPLVLHTREAEEDTLEILRETPLTRKGVAHSFTGSLRMAQTLLEMGWYIGFNGIVTFKSAEDLRIVLRQTPLDRILLETDAPFLSPMPFRGKSNDPSRIPVIAQFIAQELNVSLDEIAEQTTHNAGQLFRLPENKPD